MANSTIEMAQRGQVTIPKSLRDRYGWETGQQFTVVDLDGVCMLSPQLSRIDQMCDDLRDKLVSRGATLEDMLAELKRAREVTDA